MPKPINDTIGFCPCRIKGCTTDADIRRFKNSPHGQLYLVCEIHGIDKHSDCIFQCHLDTWIRENASWLPAGEILITEGVANYG